MRPSYELFAGRLQPRIIAPRIDSEYGCGFVQSWLDQRQTKLFLRRRLVVRMKV